jgi:hypothetical protein
MTDQVAGPTPDELAAASPVVIGGTVHIGHAVDTQPQAADFGTWQTYVTPAGADVARPVLPYDSNRSRTVLVVSAPGAPVAGSGVWVGTQGQTQASPPVGGFLPAGVYTLENNAALWLIGDGANAMRVSVLMERWA